MIKLTIYLIKAWWNGIKVLFIRRNENTFWSIGEVYFSQKENRDNYTKERNEIAEK